MIKFENGLVNISGKGIDILTEYAVITRTGNGEIPEFPAGRDHKYHGRHLYRGVPHRF